MRRSTGDPQLLGESLEGGLRGSPKLTAQILGLNTIIRSKCIAVGGQTIPKEIGEVSGRALSCSTSGKWQFEGGSDLTTASAAWRLLPHRGGLSPEGDTIAITKFLRYLL